MLRSTNGLNHGRPCVPCEHMHAHSHCTLIRAKKFKRNTRARAGETINRAHANAHTRMCVCGEYVEPTRTPECFYIICKIWSLRHCAGAHARRNNNKLYVDIWPQQSPGQKHQQQRQPHRRPRRSTIGTPEREESSAANKKTHVLRTVGR